MDVPKVLTAANGDVGRIAELLAALGPLAGLGVRSITAGTERDAVAAALCERLRAHYTQQSTPTASGADPTVVVSVPDATGLTAAGIAAAALAAGIPVRSLPLPPTGLPLAVTNAVKAAIALWADTDSISDAEAVNGMIGALGAGTVSVLGPSAADMGPDHAQYAGCALSRLTDRVASVCQRMGTTVAQHFTLVWVCRHAVFNFAAGGASAPFAAVFGLLASSIDTASVAVNDTPPKGESLLVAPSADESNGCASLLPASLRNGSKGLPFTVVVTHLLDAAIASGATVEGLPTGVAALLVTHLCKSSVTASRATIRWIMTLVHQNAQLRADAMEPSTVLAYDSMIDVAAQVLAQFGYEMPWQKLSIVATTRALAEHPVARGHLEGLLAAIAPLTFGERLQATLPPAIQGVLPVDARDLARDAETADYRLDAACIFSPPAALSAAVDEFRALLHASVVAEPHYDPKGRPVPPTDPFDQTSVRRLLLKHRSVSLSDARGQAAALGKYVVPSARGELQDDVLLGDVRLAAHCFFVGVPDVPSAVAKACRVLARAIPGSDRGLTSGTAAEMIWIDTAAELASQHLRFETGSPAPNGATACAVERLSRYIANLAEQGVVRAAAAVAFFAVTDTVVPLLHTQTLRSAAAALTRLYASKLQDSRRMVLSNEGDDSDAAAAAATSQMRVVFAEAELHDFASGIGAAVATAVTSKFEVVLGGPAATKPQPSAATHVSIAGLLATASRVEAIATGVGRHLAPHVAIGAAAHTADADATLDGGGGEGEQGNNESDEDVDTAVAYRRCATAWGRLHAAGEEGEARAGAVPPSLAALRRLCMPPPAAPRKGETNVEVVAAPLWCATLLPTAARDDAVRLHRVALQRARHALAV